MKTIGQMMKDLREDKDLSQSALGIQLGISRNTIATYENNNSTPSVDILIKYADFFNVTTDYILGRTKRSNVIIKETPNVIIEHTKDADEDIMDKFIEFLSEPEIKEFIYNRIKK